MERIEFDLNKYKKPETAAPHILADEAQRLCDKIGIPFNTMIMRAIKTNSVTAWSIADYMREKGIENIKYFTTAFYANERKRKSLQRGRRVETRPENL